MIAYKVNINCVIHVNVKDVIKENGNHASPLGMKEGKDLAVLSFLTASPHLLFSTISKIIAITS